LDPKRVDKEIERWFKEYAEENPEIAAARDVPRVPLRTGVKDDDRPNERNGADMADGKKYAPGRGNSMKPHEAAAEARKEGFSWK
jgi:hypothetical protein